MESLLNDPSLSPSKQIKNSKRKTHHLHHHQHQQARLPNISRQSSCNIIPQKFAPPPHVQLEMVHASAGGVFLNHFPNQTSLSSSLPPILPTYYQNHLQMINQQYQHQQPPLLPLPIVSKPAFRSLPPPLTRKHSLSAPLPKKQPNKTKGISATTTTKRTTPQNLKKELVTETKATVKEMNKESSLVVEDDQAEEPAKGAKLDPGSVPKEVTRVLLAADLNKKVVDEMEKCFPAPSVFCQSPPPSSLPLPKFPLRKLQQNKLSCNAEAAAVEVDTGATDNLCRLLKLR